MFLLSIGVTSIPLMLLVFFKNRSVISSLLTSVKVLLCEIKIEMLAKAADEKIIDKSIDLMFYPFV